MREWLEDLSTWMKEKEKIDPPLTDLNEEVAQAVLEADFLLQASDQLQNAYSSVVEKVENVSS